MSAPKFSRLEATRQIPQAAEERECVFTRACLPQRVFVIVGRVDMSYVFVALVLFTYMLYHLYEDAMIKAVALEMVLLGTRWMGMLADSLSVHA